MSDFHRASHEMAWLHLCRITIESTEIENCLILKLKQRVALAVDLSILLGQTLHYPFYGGKCDDITLSGLYIMRRTLSAAFNFIEAAKLLFPKHSLLRLYLGQCLCNVVSNTTGGIDHDQTIKTDKVLMISKYVFPPLLSIN